MNNSVFTGRRRRGKTTRAFDKAMRDASLVIIFDPKKEFQNWPGESHSVSDVMQAIEDGCNPIVYQPQNVEEEFNNLAEFVWTMHSYGMSHLWHADKSHKPIVFLIDEAHNVQSHQTINPILKSIMQQCRPEILVVFQTTQSPAYLYSAAKIANSEWYFFYTTHPADLKRIEAIAGPEVALLVSQLKQRRAYVWYSEDDQTYEVVTDSESWKRDLINRKEEDENVAKRRIEVDDDFLDELAKRVGDRLKKSGKPKEEEDDDDDESGFTLSFGGKKSKKEED